MFKEKLIDKIASVVYISSIIKSDYKYIVNYIKGNPCKKCLVRPCCTVVCFPRIYYNTGKEMLKRLRIYGFNKVEISLLLFYTAVVVFLFLVYILVDILERTGVL